MKQDVASRDFYANPERIRALVQNFAVHVIDVRRMPDTSVFQTDVQQVFDFVRCSEDPEPLKNLVQNDPAYQSLEEEAFDLMMLYSKSARLVKKKDYLRKDVFLQQHPSACLSTGTNT